jgi:hypothetical protein
MRPGGPSALALLVSGLLFACSDDTSSGGGDETPGPGGVADAAAASGPEESREGAAAASSDVGADAGQLDAARPGTGNADAALTDAGSAEAGGGDPRVDAGNTDGGGSGHADGGDDASCASGVWVRWKSVYDPLCDGDPEYCTYYEFDADGNAIRGYQDSSCTGTPRKNCYASEYDAQGRLIRQDLSTQCNDTLFSCATYTFDDSAMTVLETSDIGCDGGESCRGRAFDAAGNQIATYNLDDCDGAKSFCNSYTYDANGNSLDWTVDGDCDGTPETCYSRTYGADDRILTFDEDDGCDGSVERCTTYAHDADTQGSSIMGESREPCDAIDPVSCSIDEFDVHGNVTKRTWDPGCDSPPEWCFVYSYRCL